MPESILTIEGLSKRFGPTIALDNVSLDVNAGEVLALVGENGAGKSTLLKALSGAHQPDSGRMSINGKPYHPSGPNDARHKGIAMIYQELNIAPDLSIEDNIMLGRSAQAGLLLRSRQRQKVHEAMETVGIGHIRPAALARDQSVATQQMIEIARAVAGNAKVILFDEPTSSLPKKDVETLFGLIDRLKLRGIGVVYISHFLEEVRIVADRYSVLRDGVNAGEGMIDDVTDDQIISLMVGRDVDDLFPKVPHKPGKDRVFIDRLYGEESPINISLVLREGEIFGVAGLVGAGRTELMRCLFGIDYVTSGTTTVEGRQLRHSIRQRMGAGIGLLSEDRKSEGLAQELSIIENITLSHLKPYQTLGLLNLPRRNRAATEMMKKMEVKAHSGHQMISELSGGNQQKVAIGRVLHQDSDILLMDEPTKGIDVGTKAEIYRLMGGLAAEGKTVVFVSSYLPELLAVCDRIGVMAKGEMRDVRDASEWSEEAIMEIATLSDEQTL